MPCQRSGDDQAIHGIGMKFLESRGPDAYLAVDGYLHHALFQMLTSPRQNVGVQPESTLRREHGHFPEGNR